MTSLALRLLRRLTLPRPPADATAAPDLGFGYSRDVDPVAPVPVPLPHGVVGFALTGRTPRRIP